MEATASTARRRNELKALVARLPGLRGTTGIPVAEVLDPHFQAEDDLLMSTRALAAAFKAAQQAHASALNAAQQSQVGTLAHRIKQSQEFERFEVETKDARIALQRARAEHKQATAAYNILVAELCENPVYV